MMSDGSFVRVCRSIYCMAGGAWIGLSIGQGHTGAAFAAYVGLFIAGYALLWAVELWP